MIDLGDGNRETVPHHLSHGTKHLPLVLEAASSGYVEIEPADTYVHRRGSGLARYLLDLEGLDDIAFLDVLKAVQPDTALVTRCDFSRIVLETPE